MHPQSRTVVDERRRLAARARETSPRTLRPVCQDSTVHKPTMSNHSHVRGTMPSNSLAARSRPVYAPPSREINVRGSRVSNRIKAQNPVVCFLCDIGLPQYVDAMLRNGFDDMETLSDMKEEHMKSMGILPGHALKLKKRLRDVLSSQGAGEEPSIPKAPKEPVLHTADALSGDAALSIQQSWEEVRKLGSSTVGHTFYKHMFQLVPEGRKLFPMTFQRHFGEDGLFQLNLEKAIEAPPAPVLEHFTRVLQAIGTAVAGLQNKERLVPQLNALGYRHATLGLEEKYFRVGNAALMLTLHEALGARFTTGLEESWTLVYGFMSANMITGFREFRAKEVQVGEFRAELQRCVRKDEAKDVKKDPQKLMSLADKISNHLKMKENPTLLTSQQSSSDADKTEKVCETPKVEETLPGVAVA